MKRSFPLLLSLVFWFAPACKDDPAPTQACTPGKSEACVGAGGCAGGQVCDPSGAGFGACVCASGADTGTDSSADSTSPVDSTPVDSGMESGDAGPCNILAQTGCASGEKCTNVEGVNTCAPNGTVAEGSACMTTSTGDNCVGGTLCLSGVCTKVCDTAVATSCGTNYTCVRYSYEKGDVEACTPKCDPVTQVRLSDGAAACGSTDPMAPNRGCFGSPNGEFTCAPSISTKKHGDPAAGSGGMVYLNSCAPGYMPLLNERTGSTTAICVALCRPSATSTTATANAGGLTPNTCAARGATGAECRFWSYLEDPMKPKTWASDNVGFCLNYTNYTYDHDMSSSTPEIVFPSCTTLASTDAKSVEFGCTPRP